eukprot:2506501-Alexandrium_andersonii.AAC.1
MVYPVPRREGEDVWDWRCRHSQSLFEIYARHSIRPWSQQWLGRYFMWAGHLARRDHVIAELAQYRSLHWKSV